jgi:peroxiredoxin/outer membrane lipoprotein-sorting protein
MSYFTSRAFLTACGILTLGSSLTTVSAQNVPAPVPAIPGPAVTPDSPVLTVLKQAVTAQKAISALSATLSVASTGSGAGGNQTINLAFQKGLGAKVSVADKTGALAQIVSDGKTVTIYDLHTKQYRTQPVPDGQSPESVVLPESRAILPRMMSRPEGLVENFDSDKVHPELSTETLGTIPVDVITLHLPVVPNQPVIVVSLAIGHDDHLLRRLMETVNMVQKGQSKTFVHTETISDLSLTPTLTAADFTFTPPAGAKAAPLAAAEPSMYDPRLKVGARPFALTATDLSGKPLNLAQYKGKVVLMDFWATWCGPCVGEMPNVIASYKKYHAAGFEVVGISLDQDKKSLTSFIAQNKMPWRQVFDGKGWGNAVAKQYGVQSIPFGLLLNRDGTIAGVSVRGDDLPAAIKVALAKK